jgi:hypothetical protein
MDVEYKGTYNVVTEDDRKFSFPTSGTLKDVIVSETQYQVRRFGEDGGVETRSLEEDRFPGESRSLEEADHEAPEAEEPTPDDANGADYGDDSGGGYEKGTAEERELDQDGGDGSGGGYEEDPAEEEGLEEKEEPVQDYGDAADEDTMAQPGEDEEASLNEDGYVDPEYNNTDVEENTAAENNNVEDQLAEVTYEDTYDNHEGQDTENVEEEETEEAEEAAEPEYTGEFDTQDDEAADNDNTENAEGEEAVEPEYTEDSGNQDDEAADNANAEEEVTELGFDGEAEMEAAVNENEDSQSQDYKGDKEAQEDDEYGTSNVEENPEASWREDRSVY